MDNKPYQIDFIRHNLDKPVVFVGLMGAGKSTVGCMLAQQLGLDFVDSDNILSQNQKRSIPEIFEQEGEEYFRQKERETIQNILNNENPHIINFCVSKSRFGCVGCTRWVGAGTPIIGG